MTLEELVKRDLKHAKINYIRALERSGATLAEIAQHEELLKLRVAIAKAAAGFCEPVARLEQVSGYTPLMIPSTGRVACSACGHKRSRLVGDTLYYCPNCGARFEVFTK